MTVWHVITVDTGDTDSAGNPIYILVLTSGTDIKIIDLFGCGTRVLLNDVDAFDYISAVPGIWGQHICHSHLPAAYQVWHEKSVQLKTVEDRIDISSTVIAFVDAENHICRFVTNVIVVDTVNKMIEEGLSGEALGQAVYELIKDRVS